MRIKIGSDWFECKRGQPIMVELDVNDKFNISNMHPDATKYALFDDADQMSVPEKREWMEAD